MTWWSSRSRRVIHYRCPRALSRRVAPSRKRASSRAAWPDAGSVRPWRMRVVRLTPAGVRRRLPATRCPGAFPVRALAEPCGPSRLRLTRAASHAPPPGPLHDQAWHRATPTPSLGGTEPCPHEPEGPDRPGKGRLWLHQFARPADRTRTTRELAYHRAPA